MAGLTVGAVSMLTTPWRIAGSTHLPHRLHATIPIDTITANRQHPALHNAHVSRQLPRMAREHLWRQPPAASGAG